MDQLTPNRLSCSRRAFLQATAQASIAAVLCPARATPLADAEKTNLNGWQIGCYTRPWDQHDYRVALDAIASAGFKYAGLMTAKAPNSLIISVATSPLQAAEVGRDVKSRGLRLVSIYAGDFPVQTSLDAGIEGLKRLIDHCATCGSPNLMLGGTGNSQLQARYYQAVAQCCDFARKAGVGLSVKPHGGLNATGPQCRKLIEQVGQPNFRLWYDPGNIFYYSDGALDPVDDAATVNQLVVGMSVKDFRPPKEVMVTPGTGKVNFERVMRALMQGGFRSGPLVVECLERGTLEYITAQARQARHFLEQLTASLAVP